VDWVHGHDLRLADGTVRIQYDQWLQHIRQLTPEVSRCCSIGEGFLVVHVPHTTAGITINESEGNLRKDLERFYSDISRGRWDHDSIDDNAASHLSATILGSSVTIPVEGGKPALGRWQSVLFVELDGPRSREVCVMEVGR